MWDVHDFVLEGTVSQSSDFAFESADTSSLAVSDSDSGVFTVPFGASWALTHVCDIVHRNLNSAERNNYLNGFDYTPACPSLR